MLETALKLSNSRLLLAGAVFIDTVCFGTLALLLTLPLKTFSAAAPAMLLASLAMTAPVLAVLIGTTVSLVPKRHEEEERARRGILAGTVLHMGIQLSALPEMLCGCGRGIATPVGYLAYTFGWAFFSAVALFVAAKALSMYEARRAKKAEHLPAQQFPPSEL